MVVDRNLSKNTQRSYRDTLALLLPFVAKGLKKQVDHLLVEQLSADVVRLFLQHLEEVRSCCAATRNQRLAGIHALARFIGEHSPEHIAWCGQVRLVPFKKTSQPHIRVYALVERYGQRAAAKQPSLKNKKVTPHVIRHMTACHLLKAGVDLNTIRAWLGHVSLDTTNIYAEIDVEMKSKALAKCEISGDGNKKRWRDDADLMIFLKSL
jgi:site-specific recombinase XerD